LGPDHHLLYEEGGASGKTRVEVRLPRDMGIEVGGAEAENGGGLVNFCCQVNVVDLSVKVNAALTKNYAKCQKKYKM
jgi:hypothetical protein